MAAWTLLTPWLGQDLGLVFAFPTVALVGLFFGAGPGILAALVCAGWTLLPGLNPTPQDAGLQASIFLPAAILVALAANRFEFAEPAAVGEARVLVPRRDGVVWWLRLSMVLAAVLPTAFYVFAAVYNYQRTFEEAKLELDGIARVTQEHASKVFQTNEAILGRIVDAFRDYDDQAIRFLEEEVHRHLSDLADGIAHIRDIRVWNAEGRLLASSHEYPAPAESIADRDLFRQYLSSPNVDQASQPSLGRVSGEDALQFSQRRSRSDGSFAGIVTVGIDHSYFTDFYEQFVHSEPGLVLSLVRDDGVVLARWPPSPAPAGEPRLQASRQLPGYPLYMDARFERPAVLAQWYRDMGMVAALTFPTALALVLVSSVALRRARREREAVEQLHAESEKRLQVEEFLRQSQKLEAIGRMTGGVAHDVNNLLMVIDSNLHLIRKVEPAVAKSPYLAAIERTAKVGERLMRQLLAFSRRQALNPEVIRLQDKLDSLVDLIRTTLGGKIRIDAQVDADTAPIEVDAAELELAMLNLAVNARDAMPGPGVLTIRGRNLPPGEMPELAGRFVELTVSDTGKGIEVDDLQYVLEPFFTTKAPGKGTGLGLSQVYGLCAQAGGTVRIESKPGEGTRVRLFFEASDKPLAAAPESQAVVSDMSYRVLLVEDHREVAEGTKRLLESLGCSVRYASRGDAAQAILASSAASFDVVLSDIAMPGKVSGIDLAGYVRDTYPRLAVVLMTGYTAELRRANELSFTVLQKPVSPQTLVAALARARRKIDQTRSVE